MRQFTSRNLGHRARAEGVPFALTPSIQEMPRAECECEYSPPPVHSPSPVRRVCAPEAEYGVWDEVAGLGAIVGAMGGANTSRGRWVRVTRVQAEIVAAAIIYTGLGALYVLARVIMHAVRVISP